MKVTDIKTFVVDCFRTNWVFVKVCTDEGIDGVGEGTLEYKEKALVGAIEHIKGYLVGKDPRQIEKAAEPIEPKITGSTLFHSLLHNKHIPKHPTSRIA